MYTIENVIVSRQAHT